MNKKDAEDLALELRGIAGTLFVMSESFEDCVGFSLNSLGLHIERLCSDIMALEYPQEKKPKNRVREHREKLGIELTELAEMIGIPYEKMVRIEDGEEETIHSHDLVRLAEILKVKPSDLFLE